jgi:hypothetical protein
MHELAPKPRASVSRTRWVPRTDGATVRDLDGRAGTRRLAHHRTGRDGADLTVETTGRILPEQVMK